FSFVSFVLFIINISNNKTTSADELVLLMFMISNVLTVFGLTLKERWNHSYIKQIRKVTEYLIFISAFLVIIDLAVKLTQGWSHNVIFWIAFVIAMITWVYCITIASFSLTQKELEVQIRKSARMLSDNFEKAAEEFSKDIDDNGGWSEFIKTDVGQQFAKAAKKYSKSKAPRDYKNKKRKWK